MSGNQISNPKIKALSPIWALFRGFSLLFDNPGGGYTPSRAGLLKLDCLPNDSLELYTCLENYTQKISMPQMREEYHFCPLPFYSYHVTVWDGLNDSNSGELQDDDRDMLVMYLENLPNLLHTLNKFTHNAYRSPLVQEAWNMRFKCTGLAKWANESLVALLGACDQQTNAALKRMINYRDALNDRYSENFSISMWTSYFPHVTLGYFANQERAEKASLLIDEWNAMLLEVTAGIEIAFNEISLYGFDDMVSYYKAP